MRAFQADVETVSDAIGEAESLDEAFAILDGAEELLGEGTIDVVNLCVALEAAAAAHAIALDLLCATA